MWTKSSAVRVLTDDLAYWRRRRRRRRRVTESERARARRSEREKQEQVRRWDERKKEWHWNSLALETLSDLVPLLPVKRFFLWCVLTTTTTLAFSSFLVPSLCLSLDCVMVFLFGNAPFDRNGRTERRKNEWKTKKKKKKKEKRSLSVVPSFSFFLMIMTVDVRCLSSLTCSPRCFWYWWYYVYLRVLPTRRTYKYTYEMMLKSSFYHCLHCVLFALCLSLLLSLSLAGDRLHSFVRFYFLSLPRSALVSIPIENGGDGDAEYNRIWRRCRRRRSSDWLFAFEKYCIVS